MAEISHQHFNKSHAGGFSPASVVLVVAIFATDPFIPAEVQTLPPSSPAALSTPSCVDDDQGAAAPADEEPLLFGSTLLISALFSSDCDTLNIFLWIED